MKLYAVYYNNYEESRHPAGVDAVFLSKSKAEKFCKMKNEMYEEFVSRYFIEEVQFGIISDYKQMRELENEYQEFEEEFGYES